MAVISFKCPNCDGELIFDPSTQKYKCEYCNSLHDIQAIARECEKICRQSKCKHPKSSRYDYRTRIQYEPFPDGSTHGVEVRCSCNRCGMTDMLIGSLDTEKYLTKHEKMLNIMLENPEFILKSR